MNLEWKSEVEQRYAGLTAAAPADAGERMALKKELKPQPPETEPRQDTVTGDAPAFVDPRRIPAAASSTLATDEQATPLFQAGEAREFRGRWDTIQGDFVDEPRRAVEQADHLVAEAMKRLAEVFADERAKLEGQWDREESVSTEDLRLALQHYRSFFGRLLAV